MRTLLLGTDLVYNSQGDLVPIEINTNVGISTMYVEDIEDIFDFSALEAFVIASGFTKISYIGGINPLSEKLAEFCSGFTGTTIDYQYYRTINNVSIPTVSDYDEHLIIRSAYDYSAIVDDTYCKNKINFLNLISGQTFGSQFAYLDDNDQLVNNITTIPDNGTHPNFILKAIYPQYDHSIYPKFYRVSGQTELNTLLQSIEIGYFLMEFHYNPNKLYSDHIQVFRSLNLMFPPDLESLTIGQYTMLPDRSIDEFSTYSATTFELEDDDRIKYISADGGVVGPKLLSTDKVLMSGGTFKTGLNLQAGDIIKTIDIPNPNNIDESNMTADYEIDYGTFISGTTYTSNEVTYKTKIDKLTNYVTLTFTDNSTWSDTENSSYLVLRGNDVRFVYLGTQFVNSIMSGDTVILLNAASGETLSGDTLDTDLRVVSSIAVTKEIFSGYIIGVAENHLFLTQGENETSMFVSIEHNAICAPNCQTVSPCTKTQICCVSLNSCTTFFGCPGCPRPPP